LTDGTRKVISIQEITGMEGNTITMQEIFSFQQRGIGPDGKVRGRFAFCGVRPKFIDKFRAAGVKVSPELFDPKNSVEL
jgi:pilus assembly protein CpaF